MESYLRGKFRVHYSLILTQKTPNDLTNDTIDIYMYIYLNSLRIFMFYIYTCIMSVI